MADLFLARGDLSPSPEATLKDAAGAAVDLTGASVVFQFRLLDRLGPSRGGAAAIQSPATAGKVAYAWVAGDTDVPGLYNGVWVATWAGTGAVMTFPNNGFATILIGEEI